MERETKQQLYALAAIIAIAVGLIIWEISIILQ